MNTESRLSTGPGATPAPSPYAAQIVVRHIHGLHSRLAALFVRQAQRFDAELRVQFNQVTANAKSILELLCLGAPHGAILYITAEGPDAPAALRALDHLCQSFADPRHD